MNRTYSNEAVETGDACVDAPVLLLCQEPKMEDWQDHYNPVVFILTIVSVIKGKKKTYFEIIIVEEELISKPQIAD